jgi:hypothetical protein
MPIIVASLVVNVLVAGFFGLATGFSLNSLLPKLDVVFGPDTLSRRILACLYLAIAAASAVALLVVPPRLRQHLANVYAFARWSDDLADEAVSPAEAARDLTSGVQLKPYT